MSDAARYEDDSDTLETMLTKLLLELRALNRKQDEQRYESLALEVAELRKADAE